MDFTNPTFSFLKKSNLNSHSKYTYNFVRGWLKVFFSGSIVGQRPDFKT
jgi:hypothetical protein